MGANSNTFDSDIVVPDLVALAKVWVAPLDEGSEAWVTDEEARWVLQKASGLVPNGTTIVKPDDGAPIAGAADARWIKDAEAACGLIQTLSVELAADQTTTSGTYVDIPGMVINFVSSPLGGVFLIDFSGVLTMDVPPETFGEANVRILLDDNQIAVASYSSGFVQSVDTMAMTKRAVALFAGAHVLKVQWRLTAAQNSTLSSLPASSPLTSYMSLRLIESMC